MYEEKQSVVELGLRVDTGIAKTGMSALGGCLAVHDHGGNSGTELVRVTRALAVAVRRVPVRFSVVETATKVLNTHQIFLSAVVNI